MRPLSAVASVLLWGCYDLADALKNLEEGAWPSNGMFGGAFGDGSATGAGLKVKPARPQQPFSWPWSFQAARAQAPAPSKSKGQTNKTTLPKIDLTNALPEAIPSSDKDGIQRQHRECFKHQSRPLPPQEEDGKFFPVHVAYAGNWADLYGMLTSMISVTKHLSHPSHAVIHLIVDENERSRVAGIVRVFEQEVADVVKPRGGHPSVEIHSLIPFRVDLSTNTWDDSSILAKSEHNFARFYLPEYMPGVSRALWLDCDTLVQADVTPLFRMHMNNVIAATPDWHDTNFQAGVFLVDLDRWSSQGYTRQAEGIIAEKKSQGNGFGTQRVMNWLTPPGQWDVLDWSWNVAGMAILWNPEYDEALYGAGYPLRMAAEAVLRYCLDLPRILHLNWGPKYFIEPSPLGDFTEWLLPFLPKNEDAVDALHILPGWRKQIRRHA